MYDGQCQSSPKRKTVKNIIKTRFLPTLGLAAFEELVSFYLWPMLKAVRGVGYKPRNGNRRLVVFVLCKNRSIL